MCICVLNMGTKPIINGTGVSCVCILCVHCTSVKTVCCKWISHSKSNVFELLSGCHE